MRSPIVPTLLTEYPSTFVLSFKKNAAARMSFKSIQLNSWTIALNWCRFMS